MPINSAGAASTSVKPGHNRSAPATEDLAAAAEKADSAVDLLVAGGPSRAGNSSRE